VTSYKIARRSFIAGLGGSAGLLLPLLRNIEARAAGISAPLRFLVIHHPLGTQIDNWRPNSGSTTQTFTLPVNSAPFNPLKSKMVMIDGLNIVAATRIAPPAFSIRANGASRGAAFARIARSAGRYGRCTAR